MFTYPELMSCVRVEVWTKSNIETKRKDVEQH